MASKYKPAARTELIALYRLEFYKKQRNWKFCKDVCKDIHARPEKLEPDPHPEPEKPQETSCFRPCLNETYSIFRPEAETDICEDSESALNNAFVDNDSGNTIFADKTPPTPPAREDAFAWADSAGPAALSSAAPAVWPCAENAWQNAGQECVAPELFYSVPDQTEEYSVWEYEGGWSTSPAIPAEAACEDGLSAAEFFLGAAAAPHSSEIELVLPPDSESGRAAAQESRAAPLRRADRQRAFASLSLDHYDSYDERPTHDGDPDRPPRAPPLTASHQDLSDPFMIRSAPPGFNNYPVGSCGDLKSTNLYCDPISTRLLHGNFEPLGSRSDPITVGLCRDPNIIGIHSDPSTMGLHSDPKAVTPIKYTKIMGSYSDPEKTAAYNLSDYCNIPPVGSFKDSMSYRVEMVGSSGDPFVAGSFGNLPVGRGRGRLQRERVIGIGMGRPYRL